MSQTIQTVSSATELMKELERVGYLADDELATVCFLALKLQRPLFCEGEAGVGKTALAKAIAAVLGLPLFRLQCYEGLGASQALYDWDFPKQLLHLRAATAIGASDQQQLEAELYDRRFLLPRAVLRAFEASPSVLLIDEIDRADDEFEAFLLEALSDFTITVPELGTIKPATPPYVIVTSNRTREVHDALKRRCLYHWIDHPSEKREIAILRLRFPALSNSLATQIASASSRLRQENLLKSPGVAESLDWAESLLALDLPVLDKNAMSQTMGAVVKYREDQERIRQNDFAAISSVLQG